MAPKLGPKYDTAVKLVLEGMEINVAWEESEREAG